MQSCILTYSWLRNRQPFIALGSYQEGTYISAPAVLHRGKGEQNRRDDDDDDDDVGGEEK